MASVTVIATIRRERPMPDMHSGTAEGPATYLDYLTDKGIGPQGAVDPWKSATKAIFSTVEGADYADLDVSKIDADDYVSRFDNLARHKYKPDSLKAYHVRFKKALEAYARVLDDPNWKPAFRASPRRATTGNGGNGAGVTPAKTQKTTPPVVETPERTTPLPPSPDLLDYPFPLRGGQIAHLHLPANIDRADADRLAAYVRSLVMEPQLSIESGTSEGTDQ
jgi:hypothetical protein